MQLIKGCMAGQGRTVNTLAVDSAIEGIHTAYAWKGAVYFVVKVLEINAVRDSVASIATSSRI